MKKSYRHYFALQKEPFVADISHQEILVTPVIAGVQERFHYALRLGAVALVTGEIGSGKSTAFHYRIGGIHPSEYRVLLVTTSSGSILELYRQILGTLGMDNACSYWAKMTRRIRQEILDVVQGKKMKVVRVVDEASLLRLEVFAELHTLTQFEQDSKSFLPVILSGQANLTDNLTYRNSQPLASRVVARCHLKGIDQAAMEDYLRHHLKIAGVELMLFDETAVTAIQQGSGGLFQKANHP
jgi:general secretion pathway protein A